MSAATSFRVEPEFPSPVLSSREFRETAEILELVTKLAWVVEVQSQRIQILESLAGRRNVRKEQRRRSALLEAEIERCGDEAADPPAHLLATEAEIASDPAFHLAPNEANLRKLFADRFEQEVQS